MEKPTPIGNVLTHGRSGGSQTAESGPLALTDPLGVIVCLFALNNDYMTTQVHTYL